MFNEILKLNDLYKKQPHTVKRLNLTKVGRKYTIVASFDDMPDKVIGRYSDRERAKQAFETIRKITENK